MTLLKLIRLEWRKHRFARNFVGAGIAIVSILLFMIMIGVTDFGAEDYAFADYQGAFMLIDTFSRAVFIIFAGSLISKLIISEYRDKTMNVMFTYPIKRHKIIAAKLILVFIFTFTMIMFTDILMGVLLLAANQYYGFITEPVESVALGQIVLKYTISSLSLCRHVSDSSILRYAKALGDGYNGCFDFPCSHRVRGVSSSNGPTMSVNNIIVIPLTLGAIGLWIATRSMTRLETKDLN